MKDAMMRKEEAISKKKLLEQVSWLNAIVDSVHEGVIVTDIEGKILLYNKALERLEELTTEEVEGKYLKDVYKITPTTSEHLKVAKSGKAIIDMHKTYFTKEGKEISLVASTYPVYIDGIMVAVFSLCRDITKIKGLLNRTVEMQEQLKREEKKSSNLNGTRYHFRDIIGESVILKDLLNSAKKAALADCSILVYGETGTGKELIVQSIHNYSRRNKELFVAINCAAIPENLLESLLFGTVKGAFTGAVNSLGLFEQAGGGTLFLDEINSMGPSLQAKLLRVLQEKTVRRVGGEREIEVSCRIVSATNEEPMVSNKEGGLRKDLFYRLAVISLHIPSLKERKEDICLLLDYFVGKYSKIYGQRSVEVSDEIIEMFLNYQWPGNIRELEHVIESAISMLDYGSKLTMAYLPPYLKSRLAASRFSNNDTLGERYYARLKEKQGDMKEQKNTLGNILTQVEKEVILDAMKDSNGNITKAATSLGIVRQNLQYRLRKLDIK